jgi:hypothetical protein
VGKYGLFVGMFWLCAAFTKPYRAQVAAKIVEKVPELGAVLAPKKMQKTVLKDFEWEKPKNDTIQMAAKPSPLVEADTHKVVSMTKYVVYGPNALHFLITPKTSFEDLVKIRQELLRNGMGLEVLAWQMDSMGLYLQKVQLSVKGNSSRPQWVSRGSPPIAVTFHLKPEKLKSGAVSVYYIGNIPSEESLKILAVSDNDFADFEARWSKSVYKTVAQNIKHGVHNIPVPFFPAKSLLIEDSPQFYRAFAIMINEDQKAVLKVNASLKNAKFRLNDNPSTLTEIETIPPDKFIKADKYEVYDDKKAIWEIYMSVYTKQ